MWANFPLMLKQRAALTLFVVNDYPKKNVMRSIYMLKGKFANICSKCAFNSRCHCIEDKDHIFLPS